jgi:hypothetical protein
MWKKNGRYPEKCDECGKKFEQGDVYYSKWHRGGKSDHICEECYEKKFIVI